MHFRLCVYARNGPRMIHRAQVVLLDVRNEDLREPPANRLVLVGRGGVTNSSIVASHVVVHSPDYLHANASDHA